MKKMHTTRAGLTLGAMLIGFGVGTVSVHTGNARPADNGKGNADNGGRRAMQDGPRGGRGQDGRRMGGPGGPGMRDGKAHGPMLDDLLDDMDLTLAQQTAIEAARDSEKTQLEALQQQIQAVQQRTRSAIDVALTDAQRQELAAAETEMMAQRKDRRGGRGPGGNGGDGPDGEEQNGPPQGGGNRRGGGR